VSVGITICTDVLSISVAGLCSAIGNALVGAAPAGGANSPSFLPLLHGSSGCKSETGVPPYSAPTLGFTVIQSRMLHRLCSHLSARGHVALKPLPMLCATGTGSGASLRDFLCKPSVSISCFGIRWTAWSCKVRLMTRSSGVGPRVDRIVPKQLTPLPTAHSGSIHLDGHALIWDTWAHLKVKIFRWLSFLKRHWTTDRRCRHGLDANPNYTLCDQEPETSDHLCASRATTDAVGLPLLAGLVASPPSHLVGR